MEVFFLRKVHTQRHNFLQLDVAVLLGLTWREGHRWRVLGIGVLRGILGRRTDEVTGGWRNWIMRNFIIVLFTNTTVVMTARRMRRVKHVARMG